MRPNNGRRPPVMLSFNDLDSRKKKNPSTTTTTTTASPSKGAGEEGVGATSSIRTTNQQLEERSSSTAAAVAVGSSYSIAQRPLSALRTSSRTGANNTSAVDDDVDAITTTSGIGLTSQLVPGSPTKTRPHCDKQKEEDMVAFSNKNNQLEEEEFIEEEPPQEPPQHLLLLQPHHDSTSVPFAQRADTLRSQAAAELREAHSILAKDDLVCTKDETLALELVQIMEGSSTDDENDGNNKSTQSKEGPSVASPQKETAAAAFIKARGTKRLEEALQRCKDLDDAMVAAVRNAVNEERNAKAARVAANAEYAKIGVYIDDHETAPARLVRRLEERRGIGKIVSEFLFPPRKNEESGVSGGGGNKKKTKKKKPPMTPMSQLPPGKPVVSAGNSSQESNQQSNQRSSDALLDPIVENKGRDVEQRHRLAMELLEQTLRAKCHHSGFLIHSQYTPGTSWPLARGMLSRFMAAIERSGMERVAHAQDAYQECWDLVDGWRSFGVDRVSHGPERETEDERGSGKVIAMSAPSNSAGKKKKKDPPPTESELQDLEQEVRRVVGGPSVAAQVSAVQYTERQRQEEEDRPDNNSDERQNEGNAKEKETTPADVWRRVKTIEDTCGIRFKLVPEGLYRVGPPPKRPQPKRQPPPPESSLRLMGAMHDGSGDDGEEQYYFAVPSGAVQHQQLQSTGSFVATTSVIATNPQQQYSNNNNAQTQGMMCNRSFVNSCFFSTDLNDSTTPSFMSPTNAGGGGGPGFLSNLSIASVGSATGSTMIGPTQTGATASEGVLSPTATSQYSTGSGTGTMKRKSSLSLFADLMKEEVEQGLEKRGLLRREPTKAEMDFIGSQYEWQERLIGERGIRTRVSGEKADVHLPAYYISETPVTLPQLQKLLLLARSERKTPIKDSLFPYHQALASTFHLLPVDVPANHDEEVDLELDNERKRYRHKPTYEDRRAMSLLTFAQQPRQSPTTTANNDENAKRGSAMELATPLQAELTASSPPLVSVGQVVPEFELTLAPEAEHDISHVPGSPTGKQPSPFTAAAEEEEDEFYAMVPLWVAKELADLVGCSVPSAAQYEAAASGIEELVYPWGNLSDPNGYFFPSNRTVDRSSAPQLQHNQTYYKRQQRLLGKFETSSTQRSAISHDKPGGLLCIYSTARSPMGLRGFFPKAPMLWREHGLYHTKEWNVIGDTSSDAAYTRDARASAFPENSTSGAATAAFSSSPPLSPAQYPRSGMARSLALFLPSPPQHFKRFIENIISCESEAFSAAASEVHHQQPQTLSMNPDLQLTRSPRRSRSNSGASNVSSIAHHTSSQVLPIGINSTLHTPLLSFSSHTVTAGVAVQSPLVNILHPSHLQHRGLSSSHNPLDEYSASLLLATSANAQNQQKQHQQEQEALLRLQQRVAVEEEVGLSSWTRSRAPDRCGVDVIPLPSSTYSWAYETFERRGQENGCGTGAPIVQSETTSPTASSTVPTQTRVTLPTLHSTDVCTVSGAPETAAPLAASGNQHAHFTTSHIKHLTSPLGCFRLVIPADPFAFEARLKNNTSSQQQLLALPTAPHNAFLRRIPHSKKKHLPSGVKSIPSLAAFLDNITSLGLFSKKFSLSDMYPLFTEAEEKFTTTIGTCEHHFLLFPYGMLMEFVDDLSAVDDSESGLLLSLGDVRSTSESAASVNHNTASKRSNLTTASSERGGHGATGYIASIEFFTALHVKRMAFPPLPSCEVPTLQAVADWCCNKKMNSAPPTDAMVAHGVTDVLMTKVSAACSIEYSVSEAKFIEGEVEHVVFSQK